MSSETTGQGRAARPDASTTNRNRRLVGLALAGLVTAGSLAILPGAEARPVHGGWLRALIIGLLGQRTPPTTVPTTVPPTTVPPTTVPPTTTPTDPPDDQVGLPCEDTPAVDPITGTTWTCTFSDEFDGTTLDPLKWIAQTSAASGFGSHDDCYMNDPENVAVADGALRLSVVHQPSPMACQIPRGGSYSTSYTSGSVSTYQRWSQALGRFEIRARFPAATRQGLHGAFWLWPDEPTKYGPWPISGEIDVAEVYSRNNDRAIPYIHYLTASSTVTNNNCLIDDVNDFHTYTVEWTTTTITISYDDVVCLEHTIAPLLGSPGQPFDSTSPFMVALTEGLGVTNNRLDPAAPPDFPATAEIDYVRVWK